jgi:hypothetical protein
MKGLAPLVLAALGGRMSLRGSGIKKYAVNGISMWVWRILVFGIIGALVAVPMLLINVRGVEIDITGIEKHYQCADANTMNASFIYNGELQYFETVCDWGCDANLGTCAPQPIIQYAVFGIAIVGVLFLFRLVRKHG